ncbi:MAG: VWA domain-containing protein [Acidobacteriota bacterium]|nr:VWA domain-containing protein [Acidobacteriota bacterium]
MSDYARFLIAGAARLCLAAAVAAQSDQVLVPLRPGLRAEIDVNYVEAYTSVTKGERPLSGLGVEAFRVFEDGVEQDILRFEPPSHKPQHLLILIDVSESMEDLLGDVCSSVLRFLRRNLRLEDRAAIVTFRGSARLQVPWTSDFDRIERGMKGLETKGATALYDAVDASLTLFNGISGRRALFVFSDGRDEGSKLDFDSAVERVRENRVPIFTVGLVQRGDPPGAPQRLSRIAAETGGRSFLVGDAGGLSAILGTVRRELEMQYLLAYQSSAEGQGSFRRIEVRVEVPGAQARTMAGYYP